MPGSDMMKLANGNIQRSYGLQSPFQEGTMGLAEKHCVPCRGGVPPLAGGELEEMKRQVPDWTVVDGHHLVRTWTFPDFRTALEFVNRAGAVAEEEGHHPELCLTWGRVDAKIWTHAINGLTESDFILASKFDRLHPI
jgi:4a-hydroxytetrahydrobiopterin dehydratase